MAKSLTRVEKWLNEVKPAFVAATDEYLRVQAQAEPSLEALLEAVYPLAFRLELLRGSKSIRDNHRWFLGEGDDTADIAKIKELMDRLGQHRSREKFRTTIRLAALIAGRESLLLMADHLGDACRFAQWRTFNGKGVDYKELHPELARKLISEAKCGEHRGVMAAALLFRQHLKDEADKRRKPTRASRTASTTTSEGLHGAADAGDGATTLKNAAVYAQFEREYPDLDGKLIIRAVFEKGLIVEPLRPIEM